MIYYESTDRLLKILDRLRAKRKQVEEEDGVKIWFADLPYDEPDHLAWLEELDIERE